MQPPLLLIADRWKDYEIIDAGSGEKLERWGTHQLIRPDPQILWPATKPPEVWHKAHARYQRSSQGGGHWDKIRSLPDRWTIAYGDLAFNVRPTEFKHLGLFPEQAANWDWLAAKIIAANRPIQMLNLFAYTGAATVAAAKAGAAVCHVDAAKGMVNWAKDNLKLNDLQDKPVRFIVDDVLKFIQREARRKKTYDAIIMDPPSFGRGTQGETWKIEKFLLALVEQSAALLSTQPLFFLINSYTAGYSPLVLQNLLATVLKKHKPAVTCGELALPVSDTSLCLPCGVFARAEFI